MSLCEYDREILRDIRDLLIDIKQNQIDDRIWMIKRNNNIAKINQEIMARHLNLMKENNEEEYP